MEAVTHDQQVSSSPERTEQEAPKEGLQEQFQEDNPAELQPSSKDAEKPTAPLLTDAQDGVSNEVESGTAASTSAGRGTGRGRGRGGKANAGGAGSVRGKGANAGKGGGRGGRGGASTSTGRGGGAGTKRGKATTKTGRGGGSKGGGGGNSSGAVAAGSSKDQSIVGEIGGIGSGPSNTIFPLARISRIVKVDKEIEMTSKDAIWTISVATEIFIKHLTDSAYGKARLEKKKTITYKELATAVELQNEFFFLQDVIPQPITLSKALAMRQEVEDRNHMREAGLLEDDDNEEEGLDGAPLINQTIGNETTDSLLEKGNPDSVKGAEELDEEGDVAMGGEEEKETSSAPINGKARLSNGHGADEDIRVDYSSS